MHVTIMGCCKASEETVVFAECQIVYNWDDDEDTESLARYAFRSYEPEDSPFDSEAENSLLFLYGDAHDQPEEVTGDTRLQPGAGRMDWSGSDPRETRWSGTNPEWTIWPGSGPGRTRRPGRREAAAEAAGLRESRLSAEQTWLLREHLKGLYALLKAHPALMNRRLRVGSQKPHIPQHHPDYPHLPKDTEDVFGPGSESSAPPASPPPEKRSFTHLSSSVVCPARTEWRRLHVARDINNTEVEVFQPEEGSEGHQWFYTTTCQHDYDHDHHSLRSLEMGLEDCPDCCRGVNRHRYHSYCMTKTSFVMALVRRAQEQQYDWNWIQINSSCTCYISPA